MISIDTSPLLIIVQTFGLLLIFVVRLQYIYLEFDCAWEVRASLRQMPINSSSFHSLSLSLPPTPLLLFPNFYFASLHYFLSTLSDWSLFAMDQQHDSFNSHSNHYNSANAMANSLADMTINDRHHGEQFENGISPMKGEVASGKCFQADQNVEVYCL